MELIENFKSQVLFYKKRADEKRVSLKNGDFKDFNEDVKRGSERYWIGQMKNDCDWVAYFLVKAREVGQL